MFFICFLWFVRFFYIFSICSTFPFLSNPPFGKKKVHENLSSPSHRHPSDLVSRGFAIVIHFFHEIIQGPSPRSRYQRRSEILPWLKNARNFSCRFFFWGRQLVMKKLDISIAGATKWAPCKRNFLHFFDSNLWKTMVVFNAFWCQVWEM